MSIKEQFDNISETYDKQRKQLIPCFDDLYHISLSVLDYCGKTPRILDIGSGTGLFSSIILKKYPNAKITLIDLSDKMLAVAKERFKHHKDFEFIGDDYTKHIFNEKFDIIISALSIHHLSGTAKKELYFKCFELLKDNGALINIDQVLSPFPEIEKRFSCLWKEFVEKSSLSSEEISKAYERTSYDDPSTIPDQLDWLKKAGFKSTDIIYKYYHFCVLYAKK